MTKQGLYTIKSNEKIAAAQYRMVLLGDTSAVTATGQFINIKLDGYYLRRPISVCDWDNESITIIYKVLGRGTEYMTTLKEGAVLDVLTGLGNGYDTSKSGDKPLLIGGGVGCPPLYALGKKLVSEGKKVTAVLGFNTKDDMILKDEFEALGITTYVTTFDGSYGIKGFATAALDEITDYSYFYCCGNEPMMRSVYASTRTSGQMSFEERMGCGFGACMGCSCKTLYGNKRICKDGPVLEKEEIIWAD